ncbi:uncharacterized protein LOC144433032 [Glandiceps talaboti]
MEKPRDEIDLSRRNLYTFPTYLTKSAEVRKLKLEVNMLTSLPPEVSNMQYLEYVSCSNNQFEEFPFVVCRLANLKSLDFAGNKLKALPALLINLKRLEKLWLGWNNFQDFPLGFCVGELRELKELHLSHNSIARLPDNVSDLNKLEILDLSHNKISEIPSTIGGLTGLKTLDISHNELHEFPDAICDLVNLKTLKASSNRLTRLPMEFGKSLSGVQVLNLGGNPLECPPMDVCFQGIDAIREYQDAKLLGENPGNIEFIDDDDGRTKITGILKLKLSKRKPGRRRKRHHTPEDLPGDGFICARIDPDDNEMHVIHLSRDMLLEVSPGAVKEEVNITAEFVETPSCPLSLGDYEVLLTDFVELGPDGFSFEKPLVFVLERDGDIEDKTRDVVVRTTNKDGTWSDVKTWKENNVIKAEVAHFSGLVAVSKPRLHSVILTDIDSLSVSCMNDDVAVDVTTPKENKNIIHMLMALQTIDRDTLLRACELVGEYDDDFIAMGTTLKIQQDGDEFSKPISLKLPLPEFSEVNHVSVDQLRKRGILKIIRDYNDDNWRDVTDDVFHHMTSDRCLSFTEKKLHWPCCRYATVIAERGVNIEAIAQMATRMARKGWKIVNLVLLQNIKNPKSLYIDCVVKEKLDGLLKKLLNTGYEARGTLPYTRDIDLPEGETVVLEVGGENIRPLESRKYYLNFYSRRDNHLMLHVSLENDLTGSMNIGVPGEDFTGYVDFLKSTKGVTSKTQTNTTTHDNDRYDRLWFGIPKPEVTSPISTNPETSPKSVQGDKFTFNMDTEGVEIAIDILSSRLLQRDWRRLARRLGLSDADLNALEHNYPSDLREQIHQMFQVWRQREGDAATVHKLIGSLDELQIRNLCHAIKRCLGLVQENVGASLSSIQRSTTLPNLASTDNVGNSQPRTLNRRKYHVHRKSDPLDGRRSSVSMATRKTLPMAAVSVPMATTMEIQSQTWVHHQEHITVHSRVNIVQKEEEVKTTVYHYITKNTCHNPPQGVNIVQEEEEVETTSYITKNNICNPLQCYCCTGRGRSLLVTFRVGQLILVRIKSLMSSSHLEDYVAFAPTMTCLK